MKNVSVKVEFINNNNKLVKKNEILIKNTYFKIMEQYVKYIDATIIK